MEDNLKFCKFCGEKVHMDAVICTACGRQIEELKKSSDVDKTIVINNSASVNNTVADTPKPYEKNKWVAFWLCFILGGIGAHKFYEGKYILGVLYLCLCWTGISVILSIIDLIVILSKPNTTYYCK